MLRPSSTRRHRLTEIPARQRSGSAGHPSGTTRRAEHVTRDPVHPPLRTHTTLRVLTVRTTAPLPLRLNMLRIHGADDTAHQGGSHGSPQHQPARPAPSSTPSHALSLRHLRTTNRLQPQVARSQELRSRPHRAHRKGWEPRLQQHAASSRRLQQQETRPSRRTNHQTIRRTQLTLEHRFEPRGSAGTV